MYSSSLILWQVSNSDCDVSPSLSGAVSTIGQHREQLSTLQWLRDYACLDLHSQRKGICDVPTARYDQSGQVGGVLMNG